jgi:hypothetical protein
MFPDKKVIPIQTLINEFGKTCPLRIITVKIKK